MAAFLLMGVLLALGCAGAFAQTQIDPVALEAVFKDAQRVDLSASDVASVVALREKVKIPPPSEIVLVKEFRREALPAVLKPVFARPGVQGVTIGGKYVAIIHQELYKVRDDVISHELVHAYISLASPKPLPFWFQEASAVHFSTDKARKFYGQPSKDQVGVMVGTTVDVDPTYKQKLQSFHFLIEQAGKDRFYEWYRHTIETGVVDADKLLNPNGTKDIARRERKRPIPVWLIVAAAVVVIGVAIAGVYSMRRDAGYY